MQKNKKGFTLAELLIVVAIIAVLVAISIPIFTSQLEKSRDAVSISNIRAAYAEVQTAYLTSSSGGNATYTPAGTGTSATVKVAVTIKSQKADNWNGLDAELPFIDLKSSETAASGKVQIVDPGDGNDKFITFTYDADGKITNAALSES